MLSTRIILGITLVAVIAFLAWLDFGAPRPGLYLAPLAIVCVVAGSGELVRLFEENAALAQHDPTEHDQRLSPSRYVVSTGAAMVAVISFAPLLWEEYPGDSVVGRAGWVAIGLAVGLLLAVIVEMARFQAPGVATMRLAQAVLAIAYCGGLMGFVIQLRLLSGAAWGVDGRWGMVALLSLMAVVKADDTGAYFTGKLLGRTKMTPVLSPGKTWEGFLGGKVLATIAAVVVLGPLAHAMGCVQSGPHEWWFARVAVYANLVAIAGGLGDLAISLLKRDSRLKDSSTWMPGFGGVLDLLDSILFAAPLAYLMWVAGVVGP